MSYMALYRKWRPDSFEEVKGQDHVVKTLKNQIKNDRVGHAFLFCGTRGTGKTSVAKLFAKAVNCEHPVDGSPCNECASCKAIADGSAMNVIEIDAASNNGVDNIRQIREEVQYAPTIGKYSVYIIDEVHMLSSGAFNALLKTLEEPPSYVMFILATTESHKIPVTISSRCQKYDFRRITVDTISNRLSDLLEREGIKAEPKAVEYIAKAADGSMRDALSILDQCIAFNLGETLSYEMVLNTVGAVDIDIFAKLLTSINNMDVTAALDVVNEVVWQGSELSRFVSEFAWFLRNVLIVKVSPENDSNLDMSAENISRIKNIANNMEIGSIIRYINIFSDTAASIKYASQKRIVLELAVIKICKPEMETDYESILERIRHLEAKIGNVSSESNSSTDVSGDMMKQIMDQLASMNPAASSLNMYEDTEESKEYAKRLKSELPEATLNELKEFVEQWEVIIAGHQHISRGYLSDAIINVDEDGKGLYITVADTAENKGAIRYFKSKEHLDEIQREIEEATGRTCKVAFKLISNDRQSLEDARNKNLLNINFNIDYK